MDPSIEQPKSRRAVRAEKRAQKRKRTEGIRSAYGQLAPHLPTWKRRALAAPASRKGYESFGQFQIKKPGASYSVRPDDKMCDEPFIRCDREDGDPEMDAKKKVCVADMLEPIMLPSGRIWKPKELNISHVTDIDHALLLALGGRRKGKSFFVRWLYSYYPQDYFDWGIVITETKFTQFWSKMVPNAFIWDHYNSAKLKQLLVHQKEQIDQELQAAFDNRPSIRKMRAGDPDPEDKVQHNIFIIFDDVMGQQTSNLKFDSILTELGTLGRHLRITVVFLLQDPKAVAPNVRNNVDYVFIFKQDQRRAIESIYEDYLSAMLPDKKDAVALMQNMTADYFDPETNKAIAKSVMCVRIVGGHGAIEDKITVACANDPGAYQLGGDEFWRTAREIEAKKAAAETELRPDHQQRMASMSVQSGASTTPYRQRPSTVGYRQGNRKSLRRGTRYKTRQQQQYASMSFQEGGIAQSLESRRTGLLKKRQHTREVRAGTRKELNQRVRKRQRRR